VSEGFGRRRPDDLYAVLGVPHDATAEEIDRAFTRLAEDYLLTDPSSVERRERMQDLEYAYQVLSDPARRSLYDRDRTAGASWPVAGTAEPPVAATPEPVSETPSPPPATSPPAVEEAPAAPPIAPAPAPPDSPGSVDGPAAGPPPAQTTTAVQAARHRHHSWNPIDRLTANLPRPWRIAIDWAVTIIGAVLIVLALKQWIVNPYRIPSSSMEPTLHCARPGEGCEAHFSDRVLACRICYAFSSPERGQIVVFNTPPHACGVGGTFVKRLIGLPGETVSEKNGYVYIDGRLLKESYIKPDRRDSRSGVWHVPKGHYFFMGDNRAESCDSREWGSVPRSSIIGEVFFVYWPPNRIGFP
jgi:signal peptidase I